MTSSRSAKSPRPADLLKAAAAQLKRERPGMSLRAVAAKLEISPSYWSKILRGLKPFPQHLLPRMVKVLALDQQAVALLQRSILEHIEREVLAPATGLIVSRELATSPIETYRSLGREDFWLLEEWYYIPILNLFTVTDFDGSTREVAARLDLRLSQAEETLRRLVQNSYLRQTPEGRYERTDLKVRFPTTRSLAEVRKYHQAMLTKAKESLRSNQNKFNERLISGVCFAGSSMKIQEAKLILEEAMYRAANLLADEPICDQVYQLNFQLFPLIRK